jgi:hypothetical protein
MDSVYPLPLHYIKYHLYKVYRGFLSMKTDLETPSPSPSHISTDGQSVSLSWCRALSGAHDQILVTV